MFLFFLAVVLLLLWRGVEWFERSNLFYPTPDLVATPADANLPYDDLTLTTPDNEKLNAWYIPAAAADTSTPIKENFTLILFHGNGGNIGHRVDKILRLHKLGLNILICDYRGFGKSTGKPSEKGLYIDAETALQYLTHQKNSPLSKIIFYGESLGGAVATEMASRHQARALILEDTFTSVERMSKFLFPWLPAHYLVQNRFDTISKIPSIKSPVLIFHSHDDETVPYFMGKELYHAAPTGTEFIEFSGPHNDAYAINGKAYTDAIVKLLTS